MAASGNDIPIYRVNLCVCVCVSVCLCVCVCVYVGVTVLLKSFMERVKILQEE